MNARRFLFLVLTLLLAFALLPQAALVAESRTISGFVSSTTDECLRLIDARDYAGAQRLALKLIASPQWKSGDLEAAGAIRAIVDAFYAANKADFAKKVLESAQKAYKATGDTALALEGRFLPESARSSLPVIDYTKKLKPRAVSIFNPAADLKRIRVGNQASVLKVMDSTNKKVAYMRGLDGVLWAPVQEAHRQGIFTALGIAPASLDAVADQLIKGYASSKQKKECLALLGIIGSSTGNALSDGTRTKLQSFLVTTMRASKDVVLRRQACLNLALQSSILASSVDAVVLFYEKSRNLWETFPVQQVFEYQKECISLLPNKSQIKARIAAVKELYTPNILKFL
ncbi:MAG: hypothetical protein RDV48_25190 [Candidatus Eremiobacteraeota bacterium]|nr:hypothetical protein [Candidatus Eremiobacteraeota bacterium]